MDEISTGAPTKVAEWKDGSMRTYSIEPAQFHIATCEMDQFKVANPDESLRVIQSVFSGESSASADITALNAGGAIYVSGLAENLEQGVQIAQETIQSGKVSDTFNNYVEFTNRFSND